MPDRDELALFVVRGSGGELQVLTEDEAVVLEAASWRELRASLALALPPADRAAKVVLYVGCPRVIALATGRAPVSNRRVFGRPSISVVRPEPSPPAAT
jgi:hypothetical protein